MATLANLVIRLTTDTSAFEAGMKSAEGHLRSVGSAMTSIGQSASVAITAPLLAAGGAALLLGKNFNEAMANVGALGVASDRVNELKGAVQSTAILVGESSQSMAQGLYQVVSAFGDSAESADLLRINAIAAKAGLATTAEAIALTSSVTKAYGDTSASAVGQVADLALQTVALGQTTFPELAASMGRVTPIAASMGVSLEELFGFMATFSGVTGSAAEVSTQLRGAMQSLMAPTESMQALIGSLGFETGAAAVENLGLANVLRAVVTAADATGAPLQQYIGSIEGQTLALALAHGQSETFDQKLLAMGQSAGMTAQAFAAQTEGINAAGFSWDQAAIKAQVLAQRLWDGMAPAVGLVLETISPLIDRATQLADQFTQLDPRTQTIILGAVALAAAFGPVAIVAGQVITAIGAIVGVLGGLLAPLALVAAAVGVLYLAWQ
ncbi:MAG: phage tail tape measure protein, partial [Caldilineales bacterium]|nr:phage tail tape measure protein [Caldilineales bacterium]